MGAGAPRERIQVRARSAFLKEWGRVKGVGAGRSVSLLFRGRAWSSVVVMWVVLTHHGWAKWSGQLGCRGIPSPTRLEAGVVRSGRDSTGSSS